MTLIRDAIDEDVPAITEIANSLLTTTTYEWTETPHRVEDRRRWLAAQHAAGHPVLVAVEDGDVVGWTAYGDFRDSSRWPGYLPTVEHTIHVRERCWGRGIGRRLLEALADRAVADGRRVMVAGIDGTNVDSMRFHARLGFVEVARMPGIGEKFGRPLDLVLMQRTLADQGSETKAARNARADGVSRRSATFVASHGTSPVIAVAASTSSPSIVTKFGPPESP